MAPPRRSVVALFTRLPLAVPIVAIALLLASQPAQPAPTELSLVASTSGTSTDPTSPCDNLYVSSGDFNNPLTVTGNTVAQRDLKDICLLEQEVVGQIVADRGMPDNAASRQEVMTYGRDVVRAALYLRLMSLAKQDLDNRNNPSTAVPLTAVEQGGLNWLKKQLAFQNLEIAKYAQAEYNAWDANKCTWQPPSGSGVTYSTLGSDCSYSTVNQLWTGDPLPPSFQDFVTIGQWDFLHSLDTSTDLSKTMVATSSNLLVAVVTIAGGVAFAGVTGGLFIASLTTSLQAAILPFAAATGIGAGVGLSIIAVVGAAVFVVLALVGGTIATIVRIIQLADAAALPDKLQQLVDDATAKEIDPTTFTLDDYVASDVSTDDTTFLYLAYVLATLPRHDPTPGALPTATPDPVAAAPWFELTQNGKTTKAQSFLASSEGKVFRVSLNHNWWVLVPQDGSPRALSPYLGDEMYGGVSGAFGLIGYATGGDYGTGAFSVQKTKKSDGTTATAAGTKATSFTIAAPPLSDPTDGKSADAQALTVTLIPEPTADVTGLTVSPASLHAGKTTTISGTTQYAASVKVDFGDGTGTKTLTTAADGSFSTTHEYDTEGTPTVTVTAYSRTGVAGNASTKSVQVLAELPATVDTLPAVSGNEGDTLTVSGTTTETAKVSVDFGDGSAAKVLDVSGGAFSTTHTYVDNVTGSVTVTPISPLGKDGTPVSAALDVANVAPTVTGTTLSLADGTSDPVTGTPVPDTGATPSDTVRLMITFDDPGVLDTHTATITWGDHTTQTDVPITSGGYVDHVYDGSVAAGSTPITVTVTDNDGGVSDVATTSVQVDGKPQITKAPSRTLYVKEGSKLTINGLVTDGVLSRGHVTAAWRDGSRSKSALTLVKEFTGAFSLSHTYRDNKPGNAPYVVVLRPTDTDGLSGSPQYVNVVVKNAAPKITSLTARPADRSGSQIRAYDVVSLRVNFTDPGVLDTHTVAVDWGDGTRTPVTAEGLANRAWFKHAYTNMAGGTYTATVVVTDNDGATFTATTKIAVSPVVLSKIKGIWRKGVKMNLSIKHLDQASVTSPLLAGPRDALVVSLLSLVQRTHADRSSGLSKGQERDYRHYLAAGQQDITAGSPSSAADNLLVALRVALD